MSHEAFYLDAGLVGLSVEPVMQVAEPEWLMAYAASLGDCGENYLDTRRAGGIQAHPLFSTCLEWPAWLQLLRKALGHDLLERGVHVTQQLEWLRPLRNGETLYTHASIEEVRQRHSGLYLGTRFTTRDAQGTDVVVSHSGLLLHGVQGGTTGDAVSPVPPSTEFAARDSPVAAMSTLDIGAGFAHIYSACSRIWNPIHTDVAAACRAGLPGTILHGTATLALSISALMNRHGQSEPVKQVEARFTGAVALPSVLRVESINDDDAHRRNFRTVLDTTNAPVCIGCFSSQNGRVASAA